MSLQIFVYGTLKRGLNNSRYLAGQRFVGETRTRPIYRMVDCGGYPGMFFVDENGLSISGEIWEVTEQCCARLDVLEDIAAGEYQRTVIQLLPPYENAAVQGYLYKRDASFLRDVGDNWSDIPATQSGLASRGKGDQG